MTKYHAYGFRIASNFALEELLPLPADTLPDIEIEMRMIDHQDDRENTLYFEGSQAQFIMNIPHVAKYSMIKGERITIEAYYPMDTMAIKTFLLGSGFGALFHQRGLPVLHGSLVGVFNQGICLTGPSGVGKSTLMMEFVQDGYPVYSDDVCLISLASSTPQVMPSFPSAKLWEDTLLRLGYDTKDKPSILFKANKFKFDLLSQYKDEPIALNRMYVLAPEDRQDLSIEELQGSQKLAALMENTYRLIFVQAMKQQASHFRLMSILAQTVRVFILKRPKVYAPTLLKQKIIEHLKEETR
jgi:hypothetical protein